MFSAFGWLYGRLINLRNSHYEKGILKSTSLGAKTISVGNITVGGTGKTPVVAYLAEILAERGEKVCIISRGYKRKNEKTRVVVSDSKNLLADVSEAGDEPYELARRLIGKAAVISDADRVAAGTWAREEFSVTAFILDDAFQHRKAKRDLDILVIDYLNPFGNQKPLPAGILREPIENIDRADLILLTRSPRSDSAGQLISKIRSFNDSAPILTCQNSTANITALEAFSGGNSESNVLNGKSIAFCGLGNPANFFDQLARTGYEISGTKSFPDHHKYRPEDITSLEKMAESSSAVQLLTTAKDAVKLDGLKFNLPCFVVESELMFEDEKKLRKLVYAVFD